MRIPLAAFLLVTSLSSAETLVGSSPQVGDPVHFSMSKHGLKSLLEAGTLESRASQPIVSYRIGWALSKDGKVSLHEGPWMNVPAGVEPGAKTDVPDQAVPFDTAAQRYLFYISEVTYADGTRWSAEATPLIEQAKGH